ncbi:transporter [Polaribacter uvawellassae]|uniref:transporter n=1 Tax=Polaribacter uvawellassae TaxID=3133495 RepID=UPI003219F481
MKLSKKINAIIILFITGITSAQEIITDRPDQTESSSTLPAKSLQIEAGSLFQRSSGIQTNAYPSVLWRHGVTKGVEFRFLTQFETNKQLNSSLKNSGISDIQVGTKIQLLKKENINTEIAFLSHLILPTAKSELSNNNIGTINKLSISHSLSKNIDLGYNVGYDYFGTGNGNLTYSVALGVSLSQKKNLIIITP